jgi:hypothetical protein
VAPTRQKVIWHGANFPTVFAPVRQKAQGRMGSFSSATQEMRGNSQLAKRHGTLTAVHSI